MSTLMKRLFAVICIVALAAVALEGCNTIRGAGKDIEAAGQGIQDTADDAQH